MKIQSSLVNPIINLERPLEKMLKKGEYIAIKCHSTPGDNDSGSYEIILPCHGGGTPEEWFVWKDKLLMALKGQCITMGLLKYTFTEHQLIGEMKATHNQAALNIGIRTVDNFNKVLAEMIKHSFAAYASRKQNWYCRRHQVKPRSMKLSSFISRLQELNAYLEEFPPDTEGQKLHRYLHIKLWTSSIILCQPHGKTR